MNTKENSKQTQKPASHTNGITIIITYNNVPGKENLRTDWGFAALVISADRTILFDTGANGTILLDNMEKLGIEPNSIDLVVLSHIHHDHTGGLAEFLAKNNNVTVYMPKAFPKKFKNTVAEKAAQTVEITKPQKICEYVYTTGQMGTFITEQSLIIRMEKESVLITGCAHPGIAKIVQKTAQLHDMHILLVTGGFHLEWSTSAKINKIIDTFRELDVKYVAPSHCTGKKAIKLFREQFGENFINAGLGKSITLEELK